jgi:hypothetical protein
MANITSISDYKGRYSLGANEYGEEILNEYIEQEEYELLTDILGDELYNDFIANPTDQKWVDFTGPKTYTGYDGFEHNWVGTTDLIVPYIYSKWLLFRQHKAVQSGTVTSKYENSDPATEYQIKTKSYRAWNEFIQRYYECYDFLYTNSSDYENFETFFKEKTNKSLVIKSNIM